MRDGKVIRVRWFGTRDEAFEALARPRLFADWQNMDVDGRVRLNTQRALREMEDLGAWVGPE